jgi:small subunit ribosomal protein S6e
LFNLSKEDDVRQFVVRRPLPPKEGKKEGVTKAPKIQRLITPRKLQRKRRILSQKRKRQVKKAEDAAAYAKLLAQRQKEARQRAKELKLRRRTTSQSKSSKTSASSA